MDLLIAFSVGIGIGMVISFAIWLLTNIDK